VLSFLNTRTGGAHHIVTAVLPRHCRP
jgi:hypothetical protein